MSYHLLFSSLLFVWLFNVNPQMKEKADLVVKNGIIYTADPVNSRAEAMAIHDGTIVAIGTNKSISGHYDATRVIDAKGKYIYPGFIDAHCHFIGYAAGLQYVDLFGCKSFDEVLERLRKAGAPFPGKWLVGRGWDQNLWEEKNFPDNSRLNAAYPDIPVMLIRVDGHVVLANREALRRAGIGLINRFGEAQVAIKEGSLTGILSESAADLMRETVPAPKGAEMLGLLKRAEQQCFAVGLTLVCDAGLDYLQVMTIDSLQKCGQLKMQVYAMLTPNEKNINAFVKEGPYKTGKLVVRSIKIYADGSLGSRTAKLKLPYSDASSVSGIVVTSPDSIRKLCEIAYKYGYQVNTHCIGDSANSLVLGIYGSFLKGRNDLRWRIEHAQVVDPADVHLFGDYSVIPSVQATHATSDMKWAQDRLGPVRIRGAYAYKSLMQQNGWIANGTDFPIENISPVFTFYAAVARRDMDGFPEGGYMMENALTREDALRSITIWAAKAGFMEHSKGSLEIGKDADFIILSEDIMNIPARKIPEVKVLQTIIGGEAVLSK
ncbi:MAG: amidohydrolase [Bacteroidetes bacterium]|nr:amidohydrolase [Bacteroidota bacterium]